MRQMKYSGIEWIGKIPETWEVCKLNYIYRFQTGATPPSKIEKYFDGNIKWANIADLKSQYVYDTNKHLSEDGVAICNMNISPKGSLMYSFKLSVGAVAFCGCDMYTNEAIATFLEGHGNLHYLYYMAQVAIINNANYNIYGAPILNQDLIQNALVINPPLIDQQHIADYLDKKCGEIDSLIALQEQMIEKLKAYKQSVITEAVTKGLDPNAKLVPSGIDWIGEIPKGWKVGRIKNVAGLFGRIGFRGYNSDDLNKDGVGAITLSPSNMQPMDMDYSSVTYLSWEKYYESPEIMIQNGDLLYVKTGSSYGKVSYVHDLPREATINPQILRIVPKIDNKYLGYFMQSTLCEYQTKVGVVGGTIPTISQEKINNFWVLLPTDTEQRSIASYLDSKCSDIDRLIALKQQKIEALKDYKKSVIYEAVTGKTEI